MSRFGLNTISPLALIEDYFFIVRIKSYVMYEYINGITLKEYFSDPGVSDERKRNIANKVVQSMSRWHSLGITHGDLKASNIVVKKDDVYLIDTEDANIFPRKWQKRHAIARDNYIILHNWQKYPEYRNTWVRPIMLEYCFGIKYFGMCLVKKFWKDEYATLTLGSNNFNLKKCIEKIIKNKPLKDWVKIHAFKMNICTVSSKHKCVCFVSPRAYLFKRSIEAYFRKSRVPKKGIFSMTMVLRICGFTLPGIIDGGIHAGFEYVFQELESADSLHTAWGKVKNDPFEKKYS